MNLNSVPDTPVEKRDDIQAIVDADYILYLVGAISQHKAPVPQNEGQEVMQNSADVSFWVDSWGLVQWRVENELDRISDALRIDRSCFELFLTDNSNGSFRHDLAVTKPYKGQRSQPRPIMYYKIREYLVETYGARVATHCEADDYVATAQVDALRLGEVTVLVSNDKDLRTVPGLLYIPRNKELFLHTPEQAACFFLRQMVEGDTCDNIPGYPGKGKAWCNNFLTGEDYRADAEAVLKLYEGMGRDYLLEQGNLLFMRRDPGMSWVPGSELDNVSLPDEAAEFYYTFNGMEHTAPGPLKQEGWIGGGFLFSGT